MAASKAQTEIVGLLVIVILLIFLALIYIGFTAIKQDSLLPSLRTNIEVDNTLKALMKVPVGQNAESVEELLISCSLGLEGCVGLEDGVKEVLGVILKPNQAFSFVGVADDEEIVSFGVCEYGIVASYSFIKNSVFYESKLKICNSPS